MASMEAEEPLSSMDLTQFKQCLVEHYAQRMQEVVPEFSVTLNNLMSFTGKTSTLASDSRAKLVGDAFGKDLEGAELMRRWQWDPSFVEAQDCDDTFEELWSNIVVSEGKAADLLCSQHLPWVVREAGVWYGLALRQAGVLY
ncbi:UNVERIFIED_CONTAM: hypothetical protein K2H54_041246 [Gekko kuhli]